MKKLSELFLDCYDGAAFSDPKNHNILGKIFHKDSQLDRVAER